MSYATRPVVDLASVPSRRTASLAAPAERRDNSVPAVPVNWEAEAQRLRTALEDVVALASGNAELRHRCAQMQRRAIAALSGMDGGPGVPRAGRP